MSDPEKTPESDQDQPREEIWEQLELDLWPDTTDH